MLYTFVIVNGLADTISVAITRQVISSILSKRRWYFTLYYIMVDAIAAIFTMLLVFLVVIIWFNLAYILFLSKEVMTLLNSLGDFGSYVLLTYEILYGAVNSILLMDFHSIWILEGKDLEIGELDPSEAGFRALSTLFVSITLFASTTYIPTFINVLFLILYPIWDIMSTLLRYTFINFQIFMTSRKRIFGLRFSSFAAGCTASAAILLVIKVVGNI